jgi:hypothetical protein
VLIGALIFLAQQARPTSRPCRSTLIQLSSPRE